MTLSRQSWLPKAERLRVGEKRREDHGCGPGRTLLVSRDMMGMRAWCFRCNDGDSTPPPAESLAERMARVTALQRGDASLPRSACDLPEPRNYDAASWPMKYKLWLFRAGIGYPEIAELRAYYHEPSDRVVLPVYENGKLVFWQARSEGRQPKYLAPEVDRALVLPRYGRSTSPTLTEDILSAFKVGMVGEGWAMLGTRPSPRVINALLVRGATVNVWFDNDLPPKFQINRGQLAARRLIKELTAYGISCRNIVSQRDPKLHTKQEIQEYLS